MKSQKTALISVAQSGQQLKMAGMSLDEQKTCALTKEDLELVVMHQQVFVIQKAQKTVDVPLLQYIDTTVKCPSCEATQGRHHRNNTKTA